MRPLSNPPSPPNSRDFTPYWAAALFAFTLLALVPAHVYLVNRSAVAIFAGEFITATTGLAILVSLLLGALLTLLPGAARQRVTVLLAGCGLLLWVHAYCLVWQYDAMDGGPIPWENYSRRSLVDAGLWILVTSLAFWFGPRLYPRVRLVCGGLLALQLASLGINAIRTPALPLDFSKYYYVDRKSVFDFSAEKNVIVIVLDEFQTDVFAEAVMPREQYRKNFTGFTYFPDTLAAANFTELAVPAILTGQIYDNSRPRGEYLRDVFLGDSLPLLLRRLGWDVQLYPWRGFANEPIYYDEVVAANFVRRPQPADTRLTDVARLIDLALFRSMPQFAKRRVQNDGAGLAMLLFAKPAEKDPGAPDPKRPLPHELESGGTLDHTLTMLTANRNPVDGRFSVHPGPPAFKFYHLAGLHVPVKMKRDLSPGIFDYTRANFGEQAEAYAKIMGRFLDELRRLGVYDKSMIVILGDHGSGRARDLYVRPTFSPKSQALDQTATRKSFQRDKARGLPLLLVKRFGETGEIKESHVPASIVDVPATIRHELQIDPVTGPALPGFTEFQGQPLFNLKENEPRIRYYAALRWAAEKSDYVNPISLYRVEGSSWSDDSWSFVKFLTPPP